MKNEKIVNGFAVMARRIGAQKKRAEALLRQAHNAQRAGDTKASQELYEKHRVALGQWLSSITK
jgi:hypothetical protein